MKKLLLSLLFTVAAHGASAPPNVVLILCDDLGLGDISGFGYQAPLCETPHLERMAAAGAKLTRFMVPMPYCAPSRASLLTGRYPFRHGIVSNPTPDQGIDRYGLPLGETTIAEMLKPAGYDTYLVGKWHLGHSPGFFPWEQGFDDYFGILYSNDMRPVQLVENGRVVEYPVEQACLTKKYTERAIGCMERSVQADRPFFLLLAHAMPHKPLAASPAFHTAETPDDLYADVVRELDGSVGEILAATARLGIDRNTIVVFTSDNGAALGGNNGGLRGKKAESWDGGLRVPFIAHWPGKIPPGTVSPALASSIDVLPTVARIAGTALPETEIDGLDLWPLLTGATTHSPHPFLAGMRGATVCTIHTAKWKLHVVPPARWQQPTAEQLRKPDPRGPDGTTLLAPLEQYTMADFPGLTTGDHSRNPMLFDIENDPGEQHDLAAQYPEVVDQLTRYHAALPAPDLAIPQAAFPIRIIEGGRLDFWAE